LALGVIVGLVIVGALLFLPRLSAEPAVAPTNAGVAASTDPAPMEAAPALGLATAPVTIVEYADFGCPACWEWYQLGILNQLRAKYGDQIRFVWRDFPVITLLSPKAAEAGQCAHEQGKFWEFHDLVYDRNGAIEASDLQAYAANIGLDMKQFNECVTSRRYRDRVNAQQHEGFERGLKGAPAFLVNDQRVIGPRVRLSLKRSSIQSWRLRSGRSTLLR
jgi:protein-disulfide isomerase